MSRNRVDAHFHVFNAGEAVAHARYVPSYSASLAGWMSRARRVGVSRGVWVQPSFLGRDNRLMLAALKANREVLRGVAVVAADARADELQGLHVDGVRGIRLNLAGVSHEIAEWTRADRVWRTLHELGWHLELHTDQGALPRVLAQLPSDLPLVVDHMAKPAAACATDPSIAALVRRARQVSTHVKLSGAYRLGKVEAASLARIWLHELGPAALLWGSDWPCTNHEQLADYDQLFASLQAWISPKHLDDVLCHNPGRLYWDAAVA
jgi:predicted TIM-barrel fold metal-dependent hydrolase